jgi:Pentapeptide repeats (8 copies)
MNQSPSPRDEAQVYPIERRTSISSRLPLLILLSSLVIGAVWFFQQTSVRQLDWKIRRFQQHIEKIPAKSLTPVDRLSLEREQISLDRDRIDAQNATYNLLFQGIGATILGGLVWTGWQYLRRTDTHFQHANQHQTTASFSQAIAHLASDKMEVRLGGIYTLERLAQESLEDHWLTIEVLTAFVRERSAAQLEQHQPQPSATDPKEPRQLQRLPKIPTDVQSVMTVLNRRDVSRDRHDRSIELRESNLRAADLNGVELWGADLWKVNLREAQLWQAKLVGAFLGRANLTDASLWKADLEGAYLWKANLAGANLTEANLEQANLDGSNLKGANLQKTNLVNTDLRKVVGLTNKQLSTAIYDETTQLPDYLQFMSG